MNLFKTSFWSAIATIIKILAGIITTKIMAVFIGPSGIALLGNFGNITGIFSSFANGAIGSGITKYISEFELEEDKEKVVSHSIKISLVCSIIIGFFVCMFHKVLAVLTFGNDNYSSIFIVFGIGVAFYGLNSTISAILNGYRYVKYLIITGISGSVLAIILAITITIKFGLFGALINAILAQVCIFFINILFARKLRLFTAHMIHAAIDKVVLWKLLKYAVMSLVSIMVVPTSTLMIRKYIFYYFSPNEAGYIQGVWSISASYLMVVTTALSIYYLPTLSSIKDNDNLRKEIFRGYRFLLPMAFLGGILIYIFRDFIINILYTAEFLPMRKYFAFQLIGDTLKIAAWILGYLMVAKAMTRWFITTEIIFSLLYVGLSFFFMRLYGSVGVTYAYALNYFIFIIYLVIIFNKIIFKRGTNKIEK